MKNISIFCSKSDIKPELRMVHVHTKDTTRYAVATDSFRLALLDITDEKYSDIKDGYYTQKEWTTICKIMSKAKQKPEDIKELAMLLGAINADQANRKYPYPYPNYTAIIPKEDETTTADLSRMKVNAVFFSEMLEMAMDPASNEFDFGKIKQKKDNTYAPIVYTKGDITLLLMPLNK